MIEIGFMIPNSKSRITGPATRIPDSDPSMRNGGLHDLIPIWNLGSAIRKPDL
jgi:hypothetical protein